MAVLSWKLSVPAELRPEKPMMCSSVSRGCALVPSSGTVTLEQGKVCPRLCLLTARHVSASLTS